MQGRKKMNPYKVVEIFEKAMADFVGSPYAVAVDSCTNALFLVCFYHKVEEVILPSRTYVSVPCSVIHAGGKVKFEDYEWTGLYQLKPYPIFDSACQVIKGMYVQGSHQCISFSHNKPINIGKGGMIFTDDVEAMRWYKRARYEGRNEVPLSKDTFDMLGWNMYMTPEQACRGLSLLSHFNSKCQKHEYPDLSKYEIYTKANR